MFSKAESASVCAPHKRIEAIKYIHSELATPALHLQPL